MSKITEIVLKFLFYISLPCFVLGTIIPVPSGINNISVYPIDIVSIFSVIFLIVKLKDTFSIVKKDKITRYFIIFIMFALFTLIFSPVKLDIYKSVASLMYLIRLISYFSFYITAKMISDQNLIKKPKIITLIIVTITTMIILGWLQYFLYPELRNLIYLGWDPHLYRIFSTLLDPNFFGIIIVIAIFLLFSKFKERNNIFLLIFIVISTVTLAFTYSRSSYLAFFAGLFYYAIYEKRIILFLLPTLLFIGSLYFLPRPSGEGVRLERYISIDARKENFLLGLKMFSDHPVFGVGFNTLRYAKKSDTGNNEVIENNHAGAGLDSSFLTIAVTCGIVGLILYVILIRQMFMGGDIYFRLILISVIIHSFFVNSLLYPWVMYLIFILSAMLTKEKIKKIRN